VELGLRFPTVARDFSHMHGVQTKPSIQWAPAALSPAVKRLEREADHSPPSTGEVKNTRIYSSTPSQVFMALCLSSQAQGQVLLNTHINVFERM
jgi:hypothetical protein